MSNGMQVSKITYHDSIYTVPEEYMQEEDEMVNEKAEENKKENPSCWNIVSEYNGKEWDSIY
ncbi:MAG: hypothetical protein MJ229_06680 [bacterium]|nr:hypothetical protein [bacterium]